MKTHRYSTISTFHRCPRYYELKEILGHSDGMESLGDIVFGSAVHLAMQDLFEGGDGLDVFNVFWTMQRDKGLEYGRLGWAELHVLGNALIEIFRDEHMHKFVVMNDSKGAPLIERKMHGKIGEHAFSGTADFIGLFQGVPSLVDWKTAAYPYDNYKLTVNEQIYGYVELARQDLGVTLEQGVYGVAVKDPKNPRWQFKKAAITPAKRQEVLDNVKLVCDTISSTKVFHKNPNSCVVGRKICPFFEKCYGGGQDGGGEKEGSDS